MNLINQIYQINEIQENLKKASRLKDANRKKLLNKFQKLEQKKEVYLTSLDYIKDLTEMGYNQESFLKKIKDKISNIDINDILDTREYFIKKFEKIARDVI